MTQITLNTSHCEAHVVHDLYWMENSMELGEDDQLMILKNWYDKLLKILVYMTN